MDDFENPRVMRMRGNMNKNEKTAAAVAVQKMEDASAKFYAAARDTNQHQFLEFNGLLVEYIKVMKEMLVRDINIFDAEVLPLLPHHAEYLAEKLNCIFGPTFLRKPEVRDAFLAALFPGEAITIQSHDELGDDMCRS